MKLDRISLGRFSQTSTKMVVSDPCYENKEPSELYGELNRIKAGTWNAYALRTDCGGWGTRTSELQVLHESLSSATADSSVWMKAEGFEVGVDSGQAGFYDYSKYPFGNVGEYGHTNTFYGKVCEITLNESSRGGIIDGFGAVSDSGFGDGCYECYVLQNDQNEIVGAKVIFIDADEENELTEGSEFQEEKENDSE